MDITVTVDDAAIAFLTPYLGDMTGYVQRQVEGWITQLVAAYQARELDTWRDLASQIPAHVQEQIRALLEPYKEPPLVETPADRTEC